jgi:pimeloyl-ACP methyl ester carboxylesterase
VPNRSGKSSILNSQSSIRNEPLTRPKEPLCRVARFEATDGVALAGLLYEPKRRTARVAIFLHGTGGASVFESSRTNLLAAEFIKAGIAYFPFNNRGAGLMRNLNGEPRGGMAYERIRECVFDIDGAIRELRRRGYRDFTLIGHSTGANKVAVYDHYKARNPVKRYVLLAGGDDTGMLYDQLGPRRFAATLARARERRNSVELVPGSQPVMSWRAWYDMANPDGDYNVFPFLEVMKNVRLSRRGKFRYVKSIRKPALVLYGDRDQYLYGDVSRCVEILAEAIGPKTNVELAILEDADHGFGGRERELAEVIIDWLA